MGRPVELALATLPHESARALARSLRAAPLRWLGQPVGAWLAFTALLVFWHLPGPYDAAVRSDSLHALEHACLLWAGLIVWLPLLGPAPMRARGRILGRLGLVMGAMVPMSLIGIWMVTASSPLYAAHAGASGAMADQKLAAVIMLSAGNAALGLGAVWVVWAALKREERRQERRERRLAAPFQAGLAIVLLACAAGLFADSARAPAASAYDGDVRPGQAPDPRLVSAGRQLFLQGCSECHGESADGVTGTGPSLQGVGAAAADFYLRTGRMPLADPSDQPERSDSPYTGGEIDSLVNYIASLGGPPIPTVDPQNGNLAEGQRLFTEHCAGCHQVVAQGGIVTQGVAPDLKAAEAVDVAEAVEVGPYVMPRFPQLQSSDVDSLARYVDYTHDPDDAGGWGLGHIGPVPEGMVAWLLAGVALLLVIRLIGERTAR
jgi:ubiquinol-cytochrome c reductase cytochrome c subunit